MRIRQISLIVATLVVALLALVTALTVLAGSTDSPAVPGATNSYTLEDIYNRVNDGTTVISGTFQEPSSGPPTGTMHTLNEIYDLVGERAQVPKTGDAYNDACCTREDGELQKGVAWPNPRFTDNNNGTVTDNLTGLIWLKNANCAGGTADWATALSYANALYDGCTSCFGGSTDCGLSDGSTVGQWRLPNVRELQSLVHYGVYNPAVPNTAGTGKWTSGNPFTGVQSSDYYWTSTTYANVTFYAWVVYLGGGSVNQGGKAFDSFYVWPVRGGQ